MAAGQPSNTYPSSIECLWVGRPSHLHVFSAGVELAGEQGYSDFPSLLF